jgi:hypothetical protein
MRFCRSSVLVALLAVSALGACRGQGDDQQTGSVTPEEIAQSRANWPAGVSEVIDSANAAFGEKDYPTALRHYRRATELGPNVSAAWFGIYMTESARGNAAAADSAMERARQLSPGASLLHPTDTTRKHP